MAVEGNPGKLFELAQSLRTQGRAAFAQDNLRELLGEDDWLCCSRRNV